MDCELPAPALDESFVMPGQVSCITCGRRVRGACGLCHIDPRNRLFDNERAKAWHARNTDESLFE